MYAQHQDVGALSDAALNAAIARHTGGDDRHDERRAWVKERTEAILTDKDYNADLIAYLLDDPTGIKILWKLRTATAADWISAHHAFQTELRAIAERIAESDADRSFAYLNRMYMFDDSEEFAS